MRPFFFFFRILIKYTNYKYILFWNCTKRFLKRNLYAFNSVLFYAYLFIFTSTRVYIIVYLSDSCNAISFSIFFLLYIFGALRRPFCYTYTRSKRRHMRVRRATSKYLFILDVYVPAYKYKFRFGHRACGIASGSFFSSFKNICTRHREKLYTVLLVCIYTIYEYKLHKYVRLVAPVRAPTQQICDWIFMFMCEVCFSLFFFSSKVVYISQKLEKGMQCA